MAVKYTFRDWDEVRASFAASIMVNTPISSLAQNIDGPDWPIKGADETPAKYIDLTYEELIELLALKSQPPERIDQLIEVLKETLAFDDPFGDMLEQTDMDDRRDNPLLRNMTRLEIPEAYPINLTALGKDAIEFCRSEKLSTLGEFGIFVQGMAQNVIVGGDFRKLINALTHIDEPILAELLPFRAGAKGLHLLEALAQASAAQSTADRYGEIYKWFKSELDAIRADLESGGDLKRRLTVLNDPAKEAKVEALLHDRLGPIGEPEKKGFFSRLFKK